MYSFEPFSVDIESFIPKLKEMLESQKREILSIVTSNSSDYESVVKPIEDMDEKRSLFFTPLSHLNSVLNSPKIQEVYQESLPLISKFYSDISRDERVYRCYSNLKAKNDIQKRVLELEIRDFVLSGAKLDKESKKELEAIDIRLSELQNNFSQNLLDATAKWEMTVEKKGDVEGIPLQDLKSAQFEEDGKTKWKFTLQIPSYMAYITYGPNRKLREKIYRAYTTRAPQNSEIIDEILSLRAKKAQIVGFENYAVYALKTRDASSVESVVEFLTELAENSLPQGKDEIDRLKEFAKELDGIDDLAAYDVAYYSEKLKKELFDFDENDTKPYFESDRVLDGLLDIINRLFDIEFKRIDLELWHPCVKCYELYEDNKVCGRVYFDLEARENKRGGAWMHDWETHYIDSKGLTHLPSAFVVANFPKATEDNPSLLRHDDVVTLFHEMGHAIHHLFSRVSERGVSGINGVAWDVVEFPSQFLENFAYEEAILKSFAIDYRDNTPMPKELLKKIKDAKNFQSAMGMLRQIEFALFDIKLHSGSYRGKEVQELLDSIRKRYALLKPPSYNRFQNGFAHIFAGGYAAGYYSYKWAEALSADAFFECLSEGDFLLSRAKGYKEHILKRGGSDEMHNLYREWLGRDVDTTALLRLYGIGIDGE